jgi:hypothetical protein
MSVGVDVGDVKNGCSADHAAAELDPEAEEKQTPFD